MYDANTQLLYLSVFLAQPELYTKMKRVHKPSHYSPTVKKAVSYIDEYYDEYSSLPDHLMIKAVTGVEVPAIPSVDHGIESWFTKEYPKFSLHKSLELALYKADEEVQNENYDAMESIINEAYDVRLAFDYGIVYSEDPEARLKNILSRSGNISSGFKGIDGTVGMLNAGDLVIYAGPSGSGKSLFLQNHAINHWKNGLNVLQITLELHPELVSRRMDCMLLNKSVSDLYADVRATALEINMMAKKHQVGDLRVKYMPSGSSTADIKNLVKMYMNDTKKKVDILVVDYLDLVNPVQKHGLSDTFGKDKLVSEELRNIGQELGPVVLTASQLNRCLTLDTKVSIHGSKDFKEIKDVQVGDRIATHGGFNTVTGIAPIARAIVFEIITESGRSIKCSENHLFPSENGEKAIKTGLVEGTILFTQSSDGILMEDKITEIIKHGYEDTIDIETDGNHLFFANGFLTHNSAVGLDELDHSNIAGGLSKINTADLVLGILTSNAMRERGEYALQILKARNSTGTGRKIPMLINENSMRIYDDPDYVSKLTNYMKMSTDDANKHHHASEVSKTYNELQAAINGSSNDQSAPPSKSPTGNVGAVYGQGPNTDTKPDDPLDVHVSGEMEDDRFANVKNLMRRSQ